MIRYVPRDWPAAQYLAMPGIKVDVSVLVYCYLH